MQSTVVRFQTMWRHRFLLLLLLLTGAAVHAAEAPALQLGSAHAIVVDDATGEVLFEKDAATAAPIASLTKLMTAMLVLDARQDLQEVLDVTADDLDRLKNTHSGVPPGTRASRQSLLELALIASDNHAASALARHYPGGLDAFRAAAAAKAAELGLASTVIEEPTGLSPNNRSSAADMVKIVRAAGRYPEITDASSRSHQAVQLENRVRAVKNTNRLVGAPGWNILLSKTGFTNEAGRCISMRLEAAGRTVAVVLMGAMGSGERALDATNIRRWLAGEPPLNTASLRAVKGPRVSKAVHVKVRTKRRAAAVAA
jgi:D-alanyl-D-alanine carboxypeptidase/D-alanyl-D-alanine endopeptidase (penicillin-binding protein 7)